MHGNQCSSLVRPMELWCLEVGKQGSFIDVWEGAYRRNAPTKPGNCAAPRRNLYQPVSKLWRDTPEESKLEALQLVWIWGARGLESPRPLPSPIGCRRQPSGVASLTSISSHLMYYQHDQHGLKEFSCKISPCKLPYLQ